MIDAAKLSAEIARAQSYQGSCESFGDQAGYEAWHGYIKALRWVEHQGVPEVSPPRVPWCGRCECYRYYGNCP